MINLMMKKSFTLLLIVCLQISLTQAQPVVVGTGTGISVFSPINRSYDYCVYEVIYLATEINTTGPIGAIGFERVDGTNTDSIENVSIYLKHTTASTLAASNFSTTGYALVFQGKWPNTTGAGWRERLTDSAFVYNGTDNLQVLIVKDYQLAIANTPVTPRWYYTNSTTGDRARRYFGGTPITTSTSLTTTSFTSNCRITFGTVGTVEISPNRFSVYPNPSKGNINFKFADATINNTSLEIINGVGQRIYFNENVPSILTLNHLLAGIYFYSIKASHGEEYLSGKFIVD